MAAPALVALGIPKLTAHLFVFYFGVFADITPPVALAAYTAAGIAKGDPMKTGAIASRNVMVAYFIPFLFVYFPALLGKAPVMDVALTTAAAAMGVVAMSAAGQGICAGPAIYLNDSACCQCRDADLSRITTSLMVGPVVLPFNHTALE